MGKGSRLRPADTEGQRGTDRWRERETVDCKVIKVG